MLLVAQPAPVLAGQSDGEYEQSALAPTFNILDLHGKPVAPKRTMPKRPRPGPHAPGQVPDSEAAAVHLASAIERHERAQSSKSARRKKEKRQQKLAKRMRESDTGSGEPRRSRAVFACDVFDSPTDANPAFTEFYRSLLGKAAAECGRAEEATDLNDDVERLLQTLTTPLPVTFRLSDRAPRRERDELAASLDAMCKRLPDMEDPASKLRGKCLFRHPALPDRLWCVNADSRSLSKTTLPPLQALRDLLRERESLGHVVRQSPESHLPCLALEPGPRGRARVAAAFRHVRGAGLQDVASPRTRAQVVWARRCGRDSGWRRAGGRERCRCEAHGPPCLDALLNCRRPIWCRHFREGRLCLLPQWWGTTPQTVRAAAALVSMAWFATCRALRMARSGKSPHLLKKWNQDLGPAVAPLQRELLEASIALLECGGIVAYSTCSMHPAENEGVVRAVLGSCRGAVELLDTRQVLREAAPSFVTRPGIGEGMQSCARVWPQDNGSGGFFVALLRRTAEAGVTRNEKQGPADNTVLRRLGYYGVEHATSSALPLASDADPGRGRIVARTTDWRPLQGLVHKERVSSAGYEVLEREDRSVRSLEYFLVSHDVASCVLDSLVPAKVVLCGIPFARGHMDRAAPAEAIGSGIRALNALFEGDVDVDAGSTSAPWGSAEGDSAVSQPRRKLSKAERRAARKRRG